MCRQLPGNLISLWSSTLLNVSLSLQAWGCMWGNDECIHVHLGTLHIMWMRSALPDSHYFAS